ncbi:hypothetical protein ACFQ02_03405 [Seminibacterium arietis]|uniref:Uncharacterized protein n=1 Tax=Seminibacterium arietis TaxID=1173502 RepID=A0ABW3I7J0_9PAST
MSGYYKVRIGKSYLTENQIKTNQIILDEKSTVHFTPVIMGAGKNVGGIVNIVVGVVNRTHFKNYVYNILIIK